MSSLSLVYYRVNELNFKFNENIKSAVTFQIKPKIECKVTKREDNIFVNLSLDINEEISSPVPFEMKVSLSGTFKELGVNNPLTEEEQKKEVHEAFSMLYPYLRSAVSGITLNCNIPAYILPTIMPEQVTDEEQVDKFIIKKPQGLN